MSECDAEKIIATIEQHLASRAEPFVIRMLSGIDLKDVSLIRILRSERGFRLVIKGDHSMPAHGVAGIQKNLQAQLADLMSRVDAAVCQLPPKTIGEVLLTSFQSLSTRLLDYNIKPALLDLCLRSITITYAVILRKHNKLGAIHAAKVAVLSFLLKEPDKHIRRILALHQYYRLSFYARRIRYLSPDITPIGQQENFEWPDCESYARCSQLYRESRVLMTIHMGDFMGAFRHIAAHGAADRAVMSLRRDLDALDTRHLRSKNDDTHRLFRHGIDNPAGIVDALRGGNQTLAILFDLGRDFGEIAEVEFFRHRAGFVRGPAQLAIAGRARIFPFFCVRIGARNVIQMSPPFLPEVRQGESLRQAAGRVTQDLVRLAERWIHCHPEQWKYLDMLPAYFIPSPAVGEDQAAPEVNKHV